MDFRIKVINLAINSCSRFTKKCVAFSHSSDSIFPQLQQDALRLGEKVFTSVEKSTMELVRQLKSEQIYIINKKGVLDSTIKFNRAKNGCSIAPGQSTKLMNEIFEDSIMIHNHPSKVSLSPQDLVTMSKWRAKKIIATTTDGGHSILERKENWPEETHNAFKIACFRLIDKEYFYAQKLSSIRGIRNADRTNMLNEWRCEQYNKLAQEFGLTFRNKMSKTTNLDHTHNEFFKVNFIKNFTDNIIYYSKKIASKIN